MRSRSGGGGGRTPAPKAPREIRRTPRRARPTSSARASGACIARARTTSASDSWSGRSTFIETWATPPWRLDADRAQAGQAVSPPSRTSAAMRLASSTVAGGWSSTLKATSGWRAATRVAPRSGFARGGPKSGRRASGSSCWRPAPARRSESAWRSSREVHERVGVVGRQLPVEEHGEVQLLAEPLGEQKRLGACRPRDASSRYTIGATSMSSHVRVLAGSIRSRQIDPLDGLSCKPERRGGQPPGARRT